MTATVTPILTAASVGPSFVKASFTGIASPGSISVPGLVVGDVLIWVGADSPVDNVILSTQRFEPVVSVDDELQTINGNSTGVPFTIICLRGV